MAVWTPYQAVIRQRISTRLPFTRKSVALRPDLGYNTNIYVCRGVEQREETGENMPSLKSKLLIGTMKSVKPILTGFAVASQRKGLE